MKGIHAAFLAPNEKQYHWILDALEAQGIGWWREEDVRRFHPPPDHFPTLITVHALGGVTLGWNATRVGYYKPKEWKASTLN